jgi:hypothetical protein
MTRFLALLVLLTGGVLLAAQGEKAPEERPQLIRLAPQAKNPPLRALEWSLLPDPLDQTPGNAAQLWLRAGAAARAVRHKWTDAQWKWTHGGEEGTALKDLPRKEVRELLDKYTAALRLAEQASLRTRCDWEYPPLTMQNLDILPLDDIQLTREVANLVSLRCRLALSEGRFDAALKDLRVGLALGRHLGGSDLLIQELVGIAITAIMFGRIEEWVQLPGSPNLYWPLTELPRPLIDVSRSMRSELNTLYRSFPSLRDLKAKKLSPADAQAQVEKFFQAYEKLTGFETPAWQRKLGTAALAMKYYPAAKKALIERGRPEKEVEAMPTVQVVALYYLEEHDRVRDEFVKLLGLPPWQRYAALRKVEEAELKKARESSNVFITLLMPALSKVHEAQMRTERNLSGLRGAEALRLHIGRHGQAPHTFSAITEVPLPLDPFTGKGPDAWYSLKDSTAVLDVPPPPGMPARLGKRFEFTLKGR